MKKYYTTNLKEVFVVSRIITIYPSICLGPYRLKKGVTPHNFWQIIHTLDDQNTKVSEEEYIPLSKDSLLFRAPNETFYVGTESEIPSRRAIISFDIVADHMDFFRGKIFHIGVEEKRCLDEIYQIGSSVFDVVIEEEIQGCRLKDNCSPVKLQRLKNALERLIFLLYEGYLDDDKTELMQKKQILVKAVKKYLSEHIDEKITLNDISKQFMVSASTMKTVFKEVTGEGVITHFRNLKIETAKYLLEEGCESVEEIAMRLGFDTQGYFSRVFKLVTGKTPTEYKNIFKQ